MSVGRVTGKSVTEIRFRVGPDEPVLLGQILLTDEEPAFYLRVTDLEYGTEARDNAWPERMAGTLLSGDEDVVLFDRDTRLYKTVVAQPLGYLKDGRFRRPKTLPGHFAKVKRPIPGDFAFLAPKPRELELGALRSGDESLGDRIGLDPRALSQHVGIFATTGMGKSNLLKVLAGSCLESGRIGLLLLDPHGEYADGGGGQHPDGTPHKGLLHHPLAERLVVYTSRDVTGFTGQVHTLQMAVQEVHASDFANVYHVSDAQQEALHAVRAAFGRDWLVHLATDTPEQLEARFGARFQASTLNVLKRRAEAILQQPVSHTDPKVSTTGRILNDLEVGKVVLVDTSGLYPAEELLVSAVLARSVLDKHRGAYRDPATFRDLPPVCITLEEAQRVLNARGGSGNVFAQIAREGRKFKVGLGAVTQQPRLIQDELLSQFNTLFILGLADPVDRERVRQGARQDLSQVAKEIQMLEPGECLLTTPGAPFALPLKADLYEERIAAMAAKAPVRVEVDESFY